VHAAEGRTVAARITVVGRTAAHAQLVRDPERVAAAIRAEVGALGAPVWVEKVKIRTAPLLERDGLRAQGGLCGAALREVDRLRADPAALRALVAEDLASARRFEVLVGPQESEAVSTEHPSPTLDAWLVGLLDDVEEGLVETLLPEAS
jgi:hypothetical protein